MAEEAEQAPPATAESESTSSRRFMRGSVPSGRRKPASAPRPMAVPTVSKKSESMSVKTASAAPSRPSRATKPKEKSPTSEKSGSETTRAGSRATSPGPKSAPP